MKKIILKNFKYNLKKYILFFLCNVFATIEITAFLGFKSIVKKAKALDYNTIVVYKK